MHLFNQKYSKNIVKYIYIKIAVFYFNIFLNVVYFFDGKTEFSA